MSKDQRVGFLKHHTLFTQIQNY